MNLTFITRIKKIWGGAHRHFRENGEMAKNKGENGEFFSPKIKKKNKWRMAMSPPPKYVMIQGDRKIFRILG